MNANRTKPVAKKTLNLAHQLQQQEQVLADMSERLHLYQSEFAYLRPIAHWLHKIARLIWLATPKLGKLAHYPPRLLEYPDAYSLPADFDAPKISIVTPSFNQAKYIGLTLDSVLGQAYPNLQYFVQDGGSNDGTEQILQQYSEQLTGWISAPDQGQAQAINLGLQRTDGEIMAWLNSDDLLLPGALARVAEYFARHPEIDVVYGHRILIDEEDKEIGRWILPRHNDRILCWADFVPQESLFWRRRIWDAIGGKLDESFRFAMDWDLLLRFKDAGARMARLPYFLGAFRIHAAQKTTTLIAEIGKQEMMRLRQRSLAREVSKNEIRRALLPYLIIHLALDFIWRLQRYRKFNHSAKQRCK